MHTNTSTTNASQLSKSVLLATVKFYDPWLPGVPAGPGAVMQD
jgi:hypothetical protein